MEPVLPFDLHLEGAPPGGLMQALHRQLRAAVLDGRLAEGLPLPATRRLAAALGLGRNTVVAAYELLVAEGHAVARPGGRTVVTALPGHRHGPGTGGAHGAHLAPAWRQRAQDRQPPPDRPARSFRTGTPEHRFFPHAVWRRLSARALRQWQREPFSYGDPQGLPALRAAIAGHVSFVRAVACTAEDVIVTAGAQQAFDLLARTLVTPGRTRVAVEDPGYAPLRAAFEMAGARLRPVPLDDEGLRVDRLPRDVRVVCVTPSHQSPTGVVMSAARRAALLERARAQDALLVEDDYDGEFLFDARPQDALQTLDRTARVFYVGTFSKSLFPGLRLGFVVAPPWARAALVEARRCADSHGEVLTQAVLAAFIAEGHLARHIRRMRRVYAERRQALVGGLQRHLGRHLRVLPGHAGLHVAARCLDPAQAASIVRAAEQHAPGAEPIQLSTPRGPITLGLCFGYGCIDTVAIGPALRRLGQALG